MIKYFSLPAKFVLALLVFSSLDSSLASADSPDVLRIAYRIDSAPLQFVGPDDRADGILIDYWNTWSVTTGAAVEFIGGTNAETQQWLEQGEVDVIAGLFSNERRAEIFDFSQPVLYSDYSLFYQPDMAQVATVDAIAEYPIGVTEKSFHHDWLLNNYPEADIRAFPDYDSLFKAVSEKEVPLFISQAPYVTSYLTEAPMNLPLRTFETALYTRPYLAAVKKGNEDLLRLINTGITQLSERQKGEIEANWQGYRWSDQQAAAPESFLLSHLTDAEREWLLAHPVIPIGVDGNWPPVDFIDGQGAYSGIVHEYLQIFETKLGVTFEPRHFGSFKEMVNSVRAGEVNVGATIVQTEERDRNLWFTLPYFGAVKVIVSNSEGVQYSHLSQLQGKTLAMEDGFFLIEEIQALYPKIRIERYPSTSDALQALSFKQVDAYVGNQAVVSWLDEQLQLTNLVVSGDAGFAVSLQRFAVFKDPEWQPLVAIINKTIASISPPQRHAILNHWINNPARFHQSVPLVLSEPERQWLEDRSLWRIGVDPSLPPLEYINEDDQFDGVSASVLKLLAADLETEIEVVSEINRMESLRELRIQAIDLLPLANPNENEPSDILFTKPYLESPFMILVREDTSYVATVNDIRNFAVGVVQGYSLQSQLKRDYPELNVVVFETSESALRSLSGGGIGAFIGELDSSTWALKELGIRDVKIAAQTEYDFEYAIAVRSDWPELIPILNRAIDRITEQQMVQIQNQWFAVRVEHQVANARVWQAIIITALFTLPVIIVTLYWNRKLTRARNRLATSQANLAEAKKAAEQASAFKSQFLANMSHEIRTPMNAIVGMTHLLKSTPLNDQQSDYADKITRASITLLSVINDILDFSKIEAGKLDIEQEAFLLNDVVMNLTNLFALRAEEKGIELFFDVDSEIPDTLMGDSLRIEQVLVNLIQNAIKFTDTGQVLVRIALLRQESGYTKLQFSVVDTGIGIDPEQLKRLFQPFTQADASHTRLHGGTGLGLSISRQLVEMMGGELTADSMVNYGSTFTFTLALSTTSEQLEGSALMLSDDLKGSRVLVVEDNPTARHINSEILKSFSFQVDSVDNGLEAVKRIRSSNSEGENGYRLVLMDWKMRGLSGLDTAQSIRHMELALEPAIILVTAYGREYIQDEGHNKFVDAFLIKPLNASLLFDCIMKVFHQGDQASDPPEILTEKQLSGKVLLVEDHAINREVSYSMLDQLGLDVSIATNGEEAMTQLRQTTFDLVLMDIQMPVMDGITATKLIRKQPHLDKLPVVAMTAHAMKEDVQRCLDAGMNEHLAKPIDFERMVQVLSRWLNEVKTDSVAQASGSKATGGELVQGLDEEWGIVRVGGNRDLYAKLVNEFYQRHHGDLKLLESAREARDIESARRLVHTIAGVSGNIGAAALSEAATLLEKNLRSDGFSLLEELWKNFAMQFDVLFNALAASSYNRPVTVATEPEHSAGLQVNSFAQDDFQTGLAQLLDSMETGDPQSRQLLATLDGKLPPSLFDEITRELNDFEFDTAAGLLRAFINR